MLAMAFEKLSTMKNSGRLKETSA